MTTGLPPHLMELIQDALLKSFWTTKALRNFLRLLHIKEAFLSQLPLDETKREWSDRLFPLIERTDQGRSVIQHMARSLAAQSSFPDLENWEGSAEKIGAAQAAVKALKEYLSRKDNERDRETCSELATPRWIKP